MEKRMSAVEADTRFVMNQPGRISSVHGNLSRLVHLGLAEVNAQKPLLHGGFDFLGIDRGVEIKDASVVAMLALAVEQRSACIRSSCPVSGDGQLPVLEVNLDSAFGHSGHLDIKPIGIGLAVQIDNGSCELDASRAAGGACAVGFCYCGLCGIHGIVFSGWLWFSLRRAGSCPTEHGAVVS